MGPKRPKQPLEPYLDPDYFYNHGDNPALKNFMKITMANTRNGKVMDRRTFVIDKGQRLFLARNWDDFLQRNLRANTFPRAFLYFILNTAFCVMTLRKGRRYLPVGRFGIRSIFQTPLYHNFGVVGVAGVFGMMFTGVYTFYKTTKFTLHKFYRSVLMGQRNWYLQELRNTSSDGQYDFSDNILGNQDTFEKSVPETYILTNPPTWTPSYKGIYAQQQKQNNKEKTKKH